MEPEFQIAGEEIGFPHHDGPYSNGLKLNQIERKTFLV